MAILSMKPKSVRQLRKDGVNTGGPNVRPKALQCDMEARFNNRVTDMFLTPSWRHFCDMTQCRRYFYV